MKDTVLPVAPPAFWSSRLKSSIIAGQLRMIFSLISFLDCSIMNQFLDTFLTFWSTADSSLFVPVFQSSGLHSRGSSFQSSSLLELHIQDLQPDIDLSLLSLLKDSQPDALCTCTDSFALDFLVYSSFQPTRFSFYFQSSGLPVYCSFRSSSLLASIYSLSHILRPATQTDKILELDSCPIDNARCTHQSPL